MKSLNGIKKFLTVIFLLLFVSSCSKKIDTTILKTEKDIGKTIDSVYIVSNPIPKGSLDFVKENIEKDIETYIVDKLKINKEKNLVVGEPFSIKEKIYDFPIFQGNKYILTYSVIDEGGKFSFQISEGYFEEYVNKEIISNNGIYEIKFKEQSSKSKPEIYFKKYSKNEIPNEKMIYNIKNPIIKIFNEKLK